MCKQQHSEINPWWPSDAIWRHKSGITLARIMTCGLTTLSHYLRKCWFEIIAIHSSAISSKVARYTNNKKPIQNQILIDFYASVWEQWVNEASMVFKAWTSNYSLGYERAIIPHYFNFQDDVIKWKHFPRNWPFVRGIHRSPVNTPHNGQWRGALMFTLICVWINGWVNNRETGDLRRYRGHYDVIVMWSVIACSCPNYSG